MNHSRRATPLCANSSAANAGWKRHVALRANTKESSPSAHAFSKAFIRSEIRLFLRHSCVRRIPATSTVGGLPKPLDFRFREDDELVDATNAELA